MKKVGLVGWRGMVGSVLMQRMVEDGDFEHIEPVYFSTSAVGGTAPTLGGKEGGVLHDAKSIDMLKQMDIVITCQGSDYTVAIHPQLRAAGWRGFWGPSSARSCALRAARPWPACARWASWIFWWKTARAARSSTSSAAMRIYGRAR